MLYVCVLVLCFVAFRSSSTVDVASPTTAGADTDSSSPQSGAIYSISDEDAATATVAMETHGDVTSRPAHQLMTDVNISTKAADFTTGRLCVSVTVMHGPH